MYQQNKSSESKVKFRQASNYCKKVLEAAKLAYATKTKESSLPRNVALGTFGKLLIVFYTFAKWFDENFSKNSNLDGSGNSLSVFPSRTNLKLHNIYITLKMVKKVITNLDSPNISGPNCIPVVFQWWF